jgi:hypothetical protein
MYVCGPNRIPQSEGLPVARVRSPDHAPRDTQRYPKRSYSRELGGSADGQSNGRCQGRPVVLRHSDYGSAR